MVSVLYDIIYVTNLVSHGKTQFSRGDYVKELHYELIKNPVVVPVVVPISDFQAFVQFNSIHPASGIS